MNRAARTHKTGTGATPGGVVRWIVCGDLHYQQEDRAYLLCSRALALWRVLVGDAQAMGAAGILQLGDLIDGYHLPIGVCKRDLDQVAAALAESPVPVHPLLGNHETIYLPDRKHLGRTLGLADFSRVVEAGPVRFLLLDLTVDGDSHGDLTPARAAWLEARLNEAPDRPAVILHHPLCHPEEDSSEHRHYVRNSGEYRALLARHRQVRLVLTGHRHIPEVVVLRSGSERHPLMQVTLGCLTAWPLTYGEIEIDAEAGRLVFRERALGFALEPGQAEAEMLAETCALARRLRVEADPAQWSSRPRMAPALQEITSTW